MCSTPRIAAPERSLSLVFALTLFLLLPVTAAARTFTVLQDDRLLANAFSDGTPSTVDSPDPGELVWSAAIPLANQQSAIGPRSMSGTGTISVFSDVEFGGGNSIFDITFQVDETASVDFTTEFLYAEGPGGLVDFQFLLMSSTGTVFGDVISGDELIFGGDPRFDFFFDGTLDPDTYRLLVSLRSFGGNGDGDFDFTFNIVPEPGSAGLLALGLAGLAAPRRRRARTV